MRLCVPKLLAVAASLLCAAGSANAAILFELELFGSPGVTTALPGTNVTVAVFMSPGSEGVSSFTYDIVTSSSNAVLAVNQSITLPGTDPDCPATSFSNCNMSQLSAPVLNGNRIDNYNLATAGLGPNGGRYQIGVGRFDFLADEAIFNVTTAFDNQGQPISAVNTTIFNALVPEPSTACLLLLGLAGLALAGRRHRQTGVVRGRPSPGPHT